MSVWRMPARCAYRVALLAFVVGGLRGVLEYAWRDHVREFQAGDPAPWSERGLAIAQRATVEAVGIGALAFLIAVLAVCLLPLERWIGPRGARPDPGRALAASCVRMTAAFGLLIAFGAWLAREALPFLPLQQVLAFDALALAGGWLLYALFEALARRLPGRACEDPLARALAAALALSLFLHVAWRSVSVGERGALQWSIALLCAPAALVVARIGMGRLGAGLPPLLEWWERAPRVPRLLRGALLGLLLVCAALTLARFDLGSNARPAPTPAEVAAEVLPPRAAVLAGVPAQAPNVLFITVDTLRADVLSCHGYGRPTSPCIDALAAEGTRCADALSAAAWTKPATGTLLTGLYPSRHGALYHGSRLHTPKDGSTLAEVFQRAGYVTAGFVTNPNIKAIFDFNRGFDRWYDAVAEDTLTLSALRDSWFGRIVHEFTRYQFNWKYANDIDSLNARILPWLDANRERRFFLYLHYIDPHEPYAPPAEYEARFRQAHGFPLFNERKRLVGRDLYDAEVRYSDDGLARLFEHLRSLGLYENTLIVLTSDHGEEFFEHGTLGHGFNLYQEVVHVPLILRGPGVAAGRVLSETIATRDLPATLLDLVGLGITELGDGKSFAGALRASPTAPPAGPFFLESEFGQDEHDIRSFVFSGIRDGSLKLVLTERDAYRPVGAGGRQELYDLATDPLERHDLMHDPLVRARIEKLVQALQTHAQFLQEHGLRDVPTLLLSPEIRANMKALGYL
ncbi:MAG: sulfatase [Planctomycetes bacterium]|nr:sulfatase [Planctomycetota bacterium]